MTAQRTTTVHATLPGTAPRPVSGVAAPGVPERPGNPPAGACGAASGQATAATDCTRWTSLRPLRGAVRICLHRSPGAAYGPAHTPGARTSGCRSIAAFAARLCLTATAGADTSPGGQ
jgi:hypothetical protein